MTPHERLSLISILKKALSELEKFPASRRCADCKYFNGGICDLADKKIPENIIAIGCDSYAFDELSPPF